MKQTPTRRKLSISFRSRFTASESTDILQSSTVPDVTSMKLSIPNPTREMLPASTPKTTATRPSRVFHPIVKYSKDFPRCATAWRCATVSITRAYQDYRPEFFIEASQELAKHRHFTQNVPPSGFERKR